MNCFVQGGSGCGVRLRVFLDPGPLLLAVPARWLTGTYPTTAPKNTPCVAPRYQTSETYVVCTIS